MLRRTLSVGSAASTKARAAIDSAREMPAAGSGPPATRVTAVDSSAAVEHYDHVVIGGGVAGCLFAARVSHPQQRTLVVERGPDIRKEAGPFAWGYKLPAAVVAHRLHNYKYSSSTPIAIGRDVTAGASSSSTTCDLRTPSVLGGAMVALGGRTYIRGIAADYDDFPLPWATCMLPLFKRLENIEKAGPHRGLHGKFELSRPAFYSPHHLPFVESLTKTQKTPLIADFNPSNMQQSLLGSGRPQVLVEPRSGRAFSTVTDYLEAALATKGPKALQVMCGATVTGMTFTPSRRAGEEALHAASSIEVTAQDGSKKTIIANKFTLCAGALGNPQILRGSTGLPAATTALLNTKGSSLWACPAIVMQYPFRPSAPPNTLASAAASAFVRGCVLAEWRFMKRGWGFSAFDDMTWHLTTGGKGVTGDGQYPNVRVSLQPFLLGGLEPSARHGIQCVVTLRRPSSRLPLEPSTGQLSSAARLVSSVEDENALREAAAIVNSVVLHGFKNQVEETLTEARSCLVAEGPVGGSLPLGSVVSTLTMTLEGTSNVMVADGSLVPRPLLADPIPLTMALAERAADLATGKEVPQP